MITHKTDLEPEGIPYTLEEARAALRTPAGQQLDPYFHELLEFLIKLADDKPDFSYDHTTYTYTKADLELLKECVVLNTTLRGALIAFRSARKCSHEDLVEFWLDYAEQLQKGKSIADMFNKLATSKDYLRKIE